MKAAPVMGLRFGQWLAIGEGQIRDARRFIVVRCDCGTVRDVLLQSLRSGASKSCGCTAGDRRSAAISRAMRGRVRVPADSSAYLRQTVGTGVRVFSHRLIAETALGRPLPAGAVVHHVDENKHNNANSNLVICENEAYHQLLHLRMRIRAAGGNPNTDRICSGCGVRPLSEFYLMKSGKYAGHPGGECKACVHLRNVAANARRRALRNQEAA